MITNRDILAILTGQSFDLCVGDTADCEAPLFSLRPVFNWGCFDPENFANETEQSLLEIHWPRPESISIKSWYWTWSA
jgi:hypothetical protein